MVTNYYPRSAFAGLGEPPPESVGCCNQGNRRQDRLAYSTGAIMALAGHGVGFCGLKRLNGDSSEAQMYSGRGKGRVVSWRDEGLVPVRGPVHQKKEKIVR
jgi:hypothetical protein